jgi:hypothetical protein
LRSGLLISADHDPHCNLDGLADAQHAANTAAQR